MIDNPTPDQRAGRILEAFRAEFHDGNPMWLHDNIRREIEDAVSKASLIGKPRYAVGVSVLLTVNGELLLGRRKNNKAAGWLSTPGGRLEPNESIMDCARREFREETGAELAQYVKLPPGSFTDYGNAIVTPRILDVMRHSRFNDNYVMVYVHAEAFVGIINNSEPTKCEGWNWYAGYDLTGRKDITEPESILKQLPLTWTRSAMEQARVDGWNEAIGHLTKQRYLNETDAEAFIKL